jgi:GINS complex subunit 4
MESPRAGPSFIERARAAPDDDLDLILGDQDELVAPQTQIGTPLEQLIRHWMNERHAPDILPAQEELLARLLDHIRKQVGEKNSRLITGSRCDGYDTGC